MIRFWGKTAAAGYPQELDPLASDRATDASTDICVKSVDSLEGVAHSAGSGGGGYSRTATLAVPSRRAPPPCVVTYRYLVATSWLPSRTRVFVLERSSAPLTSAPRLVGGEPHNLARFRPWCRAELSGLGVQRKFGILHTVVRGGNLAVTLSRGTLYPCAWHESGWSAHDPAPLPRSGGTRG